MKTKLVVALLCGAVLLALPARAWPAETEDGDAPKQEEPAKKVAYLGVATSPVSKTLTKQLRLPDGVGLVVNYVDPEGPGKDALQAHDLLYMLEDQLLVNHPQLAVLVRMRKPADAVTLTVYREGKKQEATVKLGEAPVRARPVFPRGFWPDPNDPRAPHGMPMPDPLGRLHRSMAFGDNQGSIDLDITGGKGKIVVKDKEGNVVYEGELPVPEGGMGMPDVGALENVPEEVRERLERMMKNLRIDIDVQPPVEPPMPGDVGPGDPNVPGMPPVPGEIGR